jgi:hypothetical protein
MINLVTTVYEKDFKFVLNKKNWFHNFNNPLILNKIVIINNIKSLNEFEKLREEFKDVFIFYYSEEFLNKSNDLFKIGIDKNHKYYYYSIQHYTNIVLSENDGKYVFYVGPDCNIKSENLTDFFNNSIEILNKDDSVISTTLPWCDNFDSVGNHEQNFFKIDKKDEKFYFSKIFSDQVYFTKIEKIKNIDFSIIESLHDFPDYSVNSFEYRLTNFLIKNNNYRSIFKTKDYYIHKSF